jgi:hypothetical protein
MPWVPGKHAWNLEYKEYRELKVADLKERLARRGLSHHGKKLALASRLTENDEAQ